MKSKIFIVIYTLVVAFLLGELLTRVFFSIEIGPRIMLYGTEYYRKSEQSEKLKRADYTKSLINPDDMNRAEEEFARNDSVEVHASEANGYSKFFPNEIKSTRDVDSGERISVHINRHGFRGDDFEVQKDPEVIRVLTLGASSTFGFYNRDHETYPYQLEEILNKKSSGKYRFEVINFAIPHASSGKVAALFLSEGVPLNPDFVTFYQGRNDSLGYPTTSNWLDKIYSVMVNRFLLFALIDFISTGDRVSLADPTVNFNEHVKEREQNYLNNLDIIRKKCEEIGCRFIIANQQATSRPAIPIQGFERLKYKGFTYSDEFHQVNDKMSKGEDLTVGEYSFVIHKHLMDRLKEWAVMNNLPFVDIIDALNQDRHNLLTWVHLHPEGNKIIANEFAEKILEIQNNEKQESDTDPTE